MNTNKNMKNNNEKNDKVDLIRGDPKIAIKAIAWPMIITLVLNMVYNMVDRVWVAGLGSDPLAAIGFVTPLFIIIGGIANGFGAGANSLISRYIGANKKDSADNSALHGVIIGLILSILIPLILLPCLENLLIVMGASSVITYAKPYAAIIILGSFTLIFNGILSSELRAEGDVKRATIALIFTGVLNMIIDPIFIYTLNLGVEGAALATILSATVATCLMLYWMFIKKDTYLSFKIKEFHYNAKITKELIAVALPASVEQLIISVLTIIGNLILSIVATTTIIAGYTAAWSVIQVGMMTSVGIGTAAITVGGVAYGARDYEKLKTTCYYSIKLSMIIAIAIVILIEIFAPQIALLFSYSTSCTSRSYNNRNIKNTCIIPTWNSTRFMLSMCIPRNGKRNNITYINSNKRINISTPTYTHIYICIWTSPVWTILWTCSRSCNRFHNRFIVFKYYLKD